MTRDFRRRRRILAAVRSEADVPIPDDAPALDYAGPKDIDPMDTPPRSDPDEESGE